MNKSSLLYGPLFYDEIRILKEYANDEPFSDFYVFENSDTIRFLKPPTERFIHKPIEQNLPFDISSVLLTLIVSGITFCVVLTDENVTMLMLSIIIIFTFLSLILIRDRRLKQFEILELNYSLRVAQDDAAYQLLQRIYIRAIILSRRVLLYS